jgi:hypothetical protein
MVSPLRINGEFVPPPKRGLKFVLSTTVNSGRNANNEMIGERIGRDVMKADSVVWPMLSADEWARIMNLMSGFYFEASMPDPLNAGQWITHRCYCGDRGAEPFWLDPVTGLPTVYINCTANIIDCGIIGQ